MTFEKRTTTLASVPGEGRGDLVYVLDDDILVAETLEKMLAAIGKQPRAFNDCTAFFEAVESTPPAFITLDLMMPDMDGVKVLRRLASLKCRAKIIIASGMGERVLHAAGLSGEEHGLEIVGAVSKPFSLSTLRSLLEVKGSAGQPRQRQALLADPIFGAADIERAMQNGEFSLVYQPKIECKSGKLRGFESLLRWEHPEYGAISPESFVPIAEQFDLMGPVSEFVFNEAVNWYAEFCRSLPEAAADTHISINVSAKNLHSIDLPDMLAGYCQHEGVAPSRIFLELTETCAMDDPTNSLDIMTRLSMKGFHLSIDDFGTGYSSMAQLVRLPFSEIKVDKSFVMTAQQHEESHLAVKSILELGRSLGMQTTAEGVENESTLVFLAELGCDLAQGYHIARPMPAQDVLTWVEHRASGPYPKGGSAAPTDDKAAQA